MRMKSIQ